MRFVTQALHHYANIEHLVICQELLTHSYAQRLVREQHKRGTPVLEVALQTMERLSQVVVSQGLGAVVHQRWLRLESVKPRDELCWIALGNAELPDDDLSGSSDPGQKISVCELCPLLSDPRDREDQGSGQR